MKILIIHTFGLGDMIMFTPAFRKLIELYPNAKIDFLIFQKISAAPIKYSFKINKIYYSSFNFFDIIKNIYKLRKNSYDISFVTSGTSPLKAGVFSFLVNAKKRVGEYNSFEKIFYNTPIKYIEKLHRVENNNLLLQTSNSYKPKYWLKNKSQKKLNNSILIGIHAGSNPKFKIKRWKEEYFIKLINLLKNRFSNIEFLIFAGPSELEESLIISKETNSKLIKDLSLDEVAALISQCNIFINTDSGLGHVASCFDVEIFTIFGPAKEYKARPYSKKANVIKLNLDCQPCYGTKLAKECKEPKCLIELYPNIVFEEIIKRSKVLR